MIDGPMVKVKAICIFITVYQTHQPSEKKDHRSDDRCQRFLFLQVVQVFFAIRGFLLIEAQNGHHHGAYLFPAGCRVKILQWQLVARHP